MPADTPSPPRRHGICVWFTGLPSAGKSATSRVLAALLAKAGWQVSVLDGDVVRAQLSKGLGFSKTDRDTNIRQIGRLASELARRGGACICATVSPYRSTRSEVRDMVGAGRFIEVFVDTPLAECERRDPKGIYARARRGEISSVTGLDDPYERPERPDLVLETLSSTPEGNALLVLDHLRARGLLCWPSRAISDRPEARGPASSGGVLGIGSAVGEYRKVLLRASHVQARREFTAARSAHLAGTNCPWPLRLVVDAGHHAIDFDWISGAPLRLASRCPPADSALRTIDRLARTPACAEALTPWADNVCEYSRALDAAVAQIANPSLRVTVRQGMRWLAESRPAVFTHSDLGPHNLAVSVGEIVCFDFQTACIGPPRWDLAYLCGCLEPEHPWLEALCAKLDTATRSLAVTAAAIKFGRRLLRRSPALAAHARMTSLGARVGRSS